ncbi:MAG: hypothetical protein HC769_27185 [Cyanobacteria bacterium CRU_2_1]|nr:hypothetical protein [Cyanobacteria bacterium RU_5_0]NJR62186.1 hypothetical protein [Cyanobacteria bacterium CRU_2_1]
MPRLSIDRGAGMRAGAIALISTAVQEHLTLEQVLVKAEELGLNPEQPHLKQFILDRFLHDDSSA